VLRMFPGHKTMSSCTDKVVPNFLTKGKRFKFQLTNFQVDQSSICMHYNWSFNTCLLLYSFICVFDVNLCVLRIL
jgi:hypothetical protein